MIILIILNNNLLIFEHFESAPLCLTVPHHAPPCQLCHFISHSCFRIISLSSYLGKKRREQKRHNIGLMPSISHHNMKKWHERVSISGVEVMISHEDNYKWGKSKFNRPISKDIGYWTWTTKLAKIRVAFCQLFIDKYQLLHFE